MASDTCSTDVHIEEELVVVPSIEVEGAPKAGAANEVVMKAISLRVMMAKLGLASDLPVVAVEGIVVEK